jgi:hypothetical protein
MGAGRGKQQRVQTAKDVQGSGVGLGRGVEETIKRCLWNYPRLYQSRTRVLEHLLCGYGTGYEWEQGQMVSVYEEVIFPYEKDIDLEEKEREYIVKRDEERLSYEQWQRDHPEAAAEHAADVKEFLDTITQGMSKPASQPEPRPEPSEEEKARIERESDERLLEMLREGWRDDADRFRDIRDNIAAYSHRTAVLGQVYPMHRPEHGLVFSPLASIPDDVQPDWLAAAEEIAYTVLASTQSAYHETNPELDKKAVSENHEIAEEALARISELRAQRAA